MNVRLSCSVQDRGLPTECGELARAGDCDRPGLLATRALKVTEALVQTSLAAPRDLYDTGVLAGLARFEADTHEWPVAVVVGGLDQEPARVWRPGLGDLALDALIVGGVLARHHAQKPGQERGLCEAVKVADFRAQTGRGERVDAAEAAQPCDRLGVAAVRNGLLEHPDQRAPARHQGLHRAEVLCRRSGYAEKGLKVPADSRLWGVGIGIFLAFG